MIKGGVNKGIWVNEERHEKLKLLAKLNHQSLTEYISWVIDRGYEAAEHDLKSRIEKSLQR